jgi:hypothetical protein
MGDLEKIKLRHSGSLTTLWAIYESDGGFYKDFFFKASWLLSILIFLSSLFSPATSYSLMISIATQIVGVIPNLLGFSLGAYILVVGFGSSEILSVITTPIPGQQNFSLYQKLNAIFAVTVIFEIFTLIVSFIIVFLDKVLPIITISDTSVWKIAFFFMNSFWLLILVFSAVYCLLMLINIVKQIFIFAQTIHFTIYIAEKKKLQVEDQIEKEKNDERPL